MPTLPSLPGHSPAPPPLGGLGKLDMGLSSPYPMLRRGLRPSPMGGVACIAWPGRTGPSLATQPFPLLVAKTQRERAPPHASPGPSAQPKGEGLAYGLGEG